jgi:hypothetical protein
VHFGWEGFELEHPDDWAPVTLHGHRREGYVRIASPTRLSLQVRWKFAKQPPNLDSRLDDYMSRLQGDARKAKAHFEGARHPAEHAILYRYRGAGQGSGAILYSSGDRRVFIFEAMSQGRDSVDAVFQRAYKSFRSTAEKTDPWALFGISLRLPAGLRVDRKTFLAGRTTLRLSQRGVKMEVDRWAFAEQLLAKHDLPQWAKSVTGMRHANVTETDYGLELHQSKTWIRPAVTALIAVQPLRNQLLVVKSASNSGKWRPSWDWIGS